jgi:hypothetical protein
MSLMMQGRWSAICRGITLGVAGSIRHHIFGAHEAERVRAWHHIDRQVAVAQAREAMRGSQRVFAKRRIACASESASVASTLSAPDQSLDLGGDITVVCMPCPLAFVNRAFQWWYKKHNSKRDETIDGVARGWRVHTVGSLLHRVPLDGIHPKSAAYHSVSVPEHLHNPSGYVSRVRLRTCTPQ